MKKISVSPDKSIHHWADKLDKRSGFKVVNIKKNHFRARVNFFTEIRCWLENDSLWLKADLNGKPLKLIFIAISFFFYILPGLFIYGALTFFYFKKVEKKVSDEISPN